MADNDAITPPDVAMPAQAAPDLSGLGGPAPMPTFAGKLDGQTGQAIPNPPGSHMGLGQVLMQLGIATSAAGKAISTHGREGGAQDVAAFQEQQQRETTEDASHGMQSAPASK